MEDKIGDVIDYDYEGRKAKVKLTGNLEKGDRVRIEGKRTDFQQTVDSLETDGKDIQYVWIDVKNPVDKGDMLMKSYEGVIEKKAAAEKEKKDEEDKTKGPSVSRTKVATENGKKRGRCV